MGTSPHNLFSVRRKSHMVYWYAKHQIYLLWLQFSKRALLILASVLLWLSILSLREEAYPPVVWTMMFMFWHVLINSDDLAIVPSSSTLMNAVFLSWFLNVVTRNLRMSRCGRLLLDGNPKGYEVAEHIATKVEVTSPSFLVCFHTQIFSRWLSCHVIPNTFGWIAWFLWPLFPF